MRLLSRSALVGSLLTGCSTARSPSQNVSSHQLPIRTLTSNAALLISRSRNSDYRAGGKLGPPAAPKQTPSQPTGTTTTTTTEAQDPKFTRDMAAATRVLSDAVKEKEGGGGGVGGGSDGSAVASRLSSTFWADLLD